MFIEIKVERNAIVFKFDTIAFLYEMLFIVWYYNEKNTKYVIIIIWINNFIV